MFIRLVPTLERVRRWKRWARWTSVISIAGIALWTTAIWISFAWTTGPFGASGQQFSVSIFSGTITIGMHRRSPTATPWRGPRIDFRDMNHARITSDPSTTWDLPRTHQFATGGYRTRTLCVPFWSVTLLALACVILAAQIARRMERIMPPHPCHRCGYALDAARLDRCPECGTKARTKRATRPA